MAGRQRRENTTGDDPYPSLRAGEIITECRRAAGHTRSTLAVATGLNPFTIKIYETGAIKNPTVEVFNVLHDELAESGFIGWRVLEAYGYKTDHSEGGILPALVHTIRLLDSEAQDILLQQARRELRRGVSTTLPLEAAHK